MKKKKLPIGKDSFEKLRAKNYYYYVDKSLLIKNLLDDAAEVSLFTRPRRFGKSLNMSMLKSFFEVGSNPELFAGLAIMDEKELCTAHMGKYPVVFISLKSVDGLDFAAALDLLCELIRNEASRFKFLLQSDKLDDFDKKAYLKLLEDNPALVTVKSSLFNLTKLLSLHYGQKAILLIDEYDVPLDKAYNNSYYNEMIDLIRSMFGQALKSNDYLEFAVLTGCMRISKESIFTGLNNLKVHSVVDEQFDEYFGFTDQEVKELLAYYDLQEHYKDIREWYDGYRFGSREVYCPWDVLNYCDDLLNSPDKKPQAYWLNTSGNDILRRLLAKAGSVKVQREIEQLLTGEPLNKKLNLQLTHNEIDSSIDNIWSLLFMSGYLTMAGQGTDGSFELVIPNKEVRQIYQEQVLAWLNAKALAEADKLTDLCAAFAVGNAEVIEEQLNRELLNAISFYDAHEAFYHGFLLALLNSSSSWDVSSNVETGLGRCDILVESCDRRLGLVLEVKYVQAREDEQKLQAACEQALQQIEENKYAAILQQNRVPDIWLYGIAFYRKQCAVAAKHL